METIGSCYVPRSSKYILAIEDYRGSMKGTLGGPDLNPKPYKAKVGRWMAFLGLLKLYYTPLPVTLKGDPLIEP